MFCFEQFHNCMKLALRMIWRHNANFLECTVHMLKISWYSNIMNEWVIQWVYLSSIKNVWIFIEDPVANLVSLFKLYSYILRTDDNSINSLFEVWKSTLQISRYFTDVLFFLALLKSPPKHQRIDIIYNHYNNSYRSPYGLTCMIITFSHLDKAS